MKAAVAAGEPLLSGRILFTWRVVQCLVWAVGAVIFALLLFFPPIGVHALWHVLIPVAPALLAFAPGLWRNVCPMASTALFGRHLGFSARRKVSSRGQGILSLSGLILLFALVPMRHVIFDTSGHATAIALGSLVLLAIILCQIFEWKSGWCSGMCPIHPVEKLYGSAPVVKLPNAHCGPCERCVNSCPDSVVQGGIGSENGSWGRRVSMLILIGAFPGFVFGWFQVPDYSGGEGWLHLSSIYGWPIVLGAGTFLGYMGLLPLIQKRHHRWLNRTFAMLAIGCYYWYRLPALFGFGPFPGDGMLVDMRGVFPAWFPTASRVLTSLLFLFWLVGLSRVRQTWLVRPSFSRESKGGRTVNRLSV